MKKSLLIFVLDDDDEINQKIGKLLEENGYMNYKTFNKPELLLNEVTLDVRICIIDYRLDHAMNGIDVIDRIKTVTHACYFILISGMKSYEVIKRFCNTVKRGVFIEKDDIHFNEELLRFLAEIVDDIRFMNLFYNRIEELRNSAAYVKSLIKK